ncbi:arabinan endo-1,5-alpha-L-arabinosidase [Phnomibacter sp. MR]|uniref:arabinan endo-1,5-alpha-L-arabinosidase n=1 Tax=Phnomibacter sp. MR TaxID=3042318 RepID=UPI003A80481E
MKALKWSWWIVVCFVLPSALRAQPRPDPVGTIYTTTNTPVHDPVLIQQDSVYYLFCTGFGISVFSSANMKEWKKGKPVFDQPPAWAVAAVPGYKGHTWAPDISYHNGRYYLYYSVSAFGKNTSCIGVASTKSLHPASPDYKWIDHGKLLQSLPGRDMWNAIDPNLIVDDNGNGWLTFGSFWNGMKQVKLNKDLITVAQPEQWYTVAARPRNFLLPDSSAGDAAIEAPFIFKKHNFYYLFVSWDYCCRGEKSDYKVVVGRSTTVNGPFVDKTGRPLWQGGGSLLLQGDGKKWFGAGHNAVYTANGNDYLIYHGYDALDKGRSKLNIVPLQWDNTGWPILQDSITLNTINQ